MALSKKKKTVLVLLFFCGCLFQKVCAQSLDLSGAKVLCLSGKKEFLLRTPEIFEEEVKKRTGLKLPVVRWPLAGLTPSGVAKVRRSSKYKSGSLANGRAEILLLAEEDLSLLPDKERKGLEALRDIGAEGFKVLVPEGEGAATVLIVGKDARGLLYGVGWVLRKLEMRPGSVLLKDRPALSSTPVYSLRGHQLGYRPKTNAYDAFTVAMYDQYIRDLALFGANSIEILPPRTDDIPSSPHMVLPAAKMIVEQSRICASYGLDVWMWYPNVGKDYERPDSVQRELEERERVFSSLPKLNAIFVPAGDPGDLTPDVLFGWLEKEAVVLRKYHPEAKIWVSPQGFDTDQKWFDAFFAHVNRQYPWFGGVVFGPWVKIPVSRLRQLVNPAIPIRQYPDITHSLSCQYPIPKWDLAWAQTLGRECINPRPTDEKTIQNTTERYCIGSISYSEGTNDDVNKFVWTGQDWNPGTPVIETLRDYARFFMGPDLAETGAQGIIDLENNMRGEALSNEGVERTLLQWQRMEQNASPWLSESPRFQMCLIRAYFDAYTRRRLIYEKELEQEARDVLAQTREAAWLPVGAGKPGTFIGADEAIRKAREIIRRAASEPVLPAYRERCEALADSLYKSIGAQLTVKRHGGMQERGDFIDFIDQPLTDAPWLLSQLQAVERLGTEAEKLRQIGEILHRNDPGPGGFYDHFGDPHSWYRIVPGPSSWSQDPGNLESPHVGFGTGLDGVRWMDNPLAPGFKAKTIPRSWMSQAITLYGTPLKIHYEGLDSGVDYRIRVAYTGRFRSHMKMVTESGYTVHDYLKTGTEPLYEFDLPGTAIKNGQVTFVWTCLETDRGAQVTEMWLMRKK
ncbi:MAG: hypothetical protein P4L51_15940 [Puia sp.]|nr:hypothetical protein [Puia sp.]